MRPEVLQVIDYFSKQIYDIQFINLPETTKKKTVDINARLCSDALSCDVPSVTHTSEYVLSRGVWWSEKALNMFWNEKIYNSNGTIARTIRQRRKGYQNDLKKRMFTVEHEFPLGIIKTKVMKKEFKSPDQVKKYLLKYNKSTIVTQEENERLKNAGKRTAKKLEDAVDRYEICGIKVVEFSEFPKLPL